MKKSVRALVGLVVLDLFLLAGAGWMVLQVQSGNWSGSNPGAAITQITSTAGMAIGLITVILAIAFVVHRKRGN